MQAQPCFRSHNSSLWKLHDTELALACLSCIFSSENAGNSAYPQSCEMSFLSGLGGFLNMLQESLPRDCSSYGLFLLLLFSWLSLLLSASCCCSCPHSCLSSLHIP